MSGGVGKGQGLGLEQDEPRKEKRDGFEDAGWPRPRLSHPKVVTPKLSQLPRTMRSCQHVLQPPTGRGKAGQEPFSQFKQLPLITPLTGSRGGGKDTSKGGAD